MTKKKVDFKTVYQNKTSPKVALSPRRFCETFGGNLAHTVGRAVFRVGRPMVVEHVGGLLLEHDLSGSVITSGYGEEYSIVHVKKEDPLDRMDMKVPACPYLAALFKGEEY